VLRTLQPLSPDRFRKDACQRRRDHHQENDMQATLGNAVQIGIPHEAATAESARYARVIRASKRVRWDIDTDIIRGRGFDFSHKFLPDGLSKVRELEFLDPAERRRLSQVQGRTYAYMFGLVERFIGAKVLELSGRHWLGDQVALEALVRFSDEELKHQELFRRIETMVGAGMPDGYVQVADANEVARAVLASSTWAVLALTCHIELFSQAHFKESIEADPDLSPLWKDVFRYHWMEEVQHAMLDELEWIREDSRLDAPQRDRAVDELIGLVGAVDGIVNAQAAADSDYFVSISPRAYTTQQVAVLQATMLRAYRWQYIVSGAQHPYFARLLTCMTTSAQLSRIHSALAPIVNG
jgi:hypothetical protein